METSVLQTGSRVCFRKRCSLSRVATAQSVVLCVWLSWMELCRAVMHVVLRTVIHVASWSLLQAVVDSCVELTLRRHGHLCEIAHAVVRNLS